MKPQKTILDILSGIKSSEEMDDFIVGILTPQEIEEITNRISIVKMLKAGIPQHEIAQKLHVGIATITRGSKELQKGRFKYIKPEVQNDNP